jgi:4-amino-4-deoxychorismate lyase
MSPESAIWLDGTPASTLPLPDRGVDFGDGLFETLLLYRGKPLYTGLHLERLQRGLQVLDIPDCLPDVERHMAEAVHDVGERNWECAALRLTVVRASGPRGYAPGDPAPPRILLVATRLERDCGRLSGPASLVQVAIRLAAQPVLAGIKHLNRLEQVLAAAEAKREGADEGLVLDTAGRLVSVVAGNLFLVRHGELCTPALEDCGVQGTRRRLILERWAPALGIEVREKALTVADLEGAQEVFYSNSLVGVRPVSRLNECRWSEYPVCEALFDRFREELA